MASAASNVNFDAHIPSWGGDVDCYVQTKTTNDLVSCVYVNVGQDRTNFWVMKQEGGVRLSNTQYIDKGEQGFWRTLAYSNGIASSGHNIILRADGASPDSWHVSGMFNADTNE